ncbi:MAG: iron-containing redox enzyme family protein [Myxococcota bacterium]
MEEAEFQEALLQVMERKSHWAWPAFTQGRVAKDKLHIHLEQEYATYVRDFPVLVGRAYVSCPLPHVRAELIENVFEEETGGIAAGRPHPDLFLEYPRGLGMDLSRFTEVRLLPGARRYRRFLDSATEREGWDIATAVVTLFIEGTPFERGELDEKASKRPTPPLEDHPLVKHYGLPLEHLALTKAHRSVEGSHRAAAWRAVLSAVAPDRRAAVVEAMEDALFHWLEYRDDVATACGLRRQ